MSAKVPPGINWSAVLAKHGSHDQRSHGRRGGRGSAAAPDSNPALHSGGGRLSRFRENRSGPGGSVMDHPAHAKAVSEFEEKIKQDQTREHAMVVNSDGSVAVMSGEQFAVEIKTKGPGAHITHNHPAPPGAPLSDMDIAVAKDVNLRSIRAVSYDPTTNTTYEYEVQRPARGWSERMVWDSMTLTDRVQKKYHPRFKAGETEEEISRDAYPDMYEMQKKMFDKYKVEHSLKKYKGRRRKALELPVATPDDLQGEDLESSMEQTALIDDSSVMSFGAGVSERIQERLRLRMTEHAQGKSVELAEKAKKPKAPKEPVVDKRTFDERVRAAEKEAWEYERLRDAATRAEWAEERARNTPEHGAAKEALEGARKLAQRARDRAGNARLAAQAAAPPDLKPLFGSGWRPREETRPRTTGPRRPPKEDRPLSPAERAWRAAGERPATKPQRSGAGRILGPVTDALKPPGKPKLPRGENTSSNVGYYTSQEELDRAIERALLASSPERMMKQLKELLKYYSPDELSERVRDNIHNEVQATAEEVIRGAAKKIGKEELYDKLRKGIRNFQLGQRGGANEQERRLRREMQPGRIVNRAISKLSDRLEYTPFGWRFDNKAQRWEQFLPHRTLTPEESQRHLEERMKTSQERMARYAQRYANKNMSRAAFISLMHKELTHIHTQARLLAVGGRSNANFADWGTMGRQLRREFEWLEKFADHRDDSKLRRMDPNYAQRRARLYAGTNVKATYYRGLSDSHKRAGFKFKRRFGPHDDGTCETCRREIQAGWVPISEKGWEIGHTECRIGDRCIIEYSQTGTESKSQHDHSHDVPGIDWNMILTKHEGARR